MDEDESVDADSDGFWSRMATALPQTTETALAQRGGGDDDGHVINGVPDDAINRCVAVCACADAVAWMKSSMMGLQRSRDV